MNKLVETLKENDQDFEFYPTTKAMLDIIYGDLYPKVKQTYNSCKILDIGAGTCNFKKYLVDYINSIPESNHKGFGYYVIEKSQIMLNSYGIDDNIFVLGTDFHQTTLIDKSVDFIFCNPPYSEFKEWTAKILKESTAKSIYMVIPQRWKEDKNLIAFIDKHYDYTILGSDDFSNAERQARAKIDIICFEKKCQDYDPYATFFDECFGVKGFEADTRSSRIKDEEDAKTISNKLVSAKNKAEMLVDLYNADLDKFMQSLRAITSIDADLLKQIGVSKESLLESLKSKIAGLKNLYWNQVMNEMEEITLRLTHHSRELLTKKFTDMKIVDFTLSNIQNTVIWVVKNAKDFYDTQLVTLFKDMSDYENVKNYKSNERVFEKERWGYFHYSETKYSHYNLDYRIVLTHHSFVSNSWENRLDIRAIMVWVDDILAVANNLGFGINTSYERPDEQGFGKKNYVYLNNGDVFMEYKVFKNGNCHIKLNVEFTKALNVEASRLLGWIKNKQDVVKEFDDSMQGAEKYFMSNFSNQITSSSVKMLASS